MQSPLWSPSPDRIADANITRFMARVNANHNAGAHDYASLYNWSIERPQDFWAELWRFCGVRSNREWSRVLANENAMPGAKWFAGSQFNFAENLLARDDAAPALVFCNERQDRRELSYQKLRAEVARVASGLRALGVAKGDRVVGFMPNLPETVIAMLAAASIGAVWSSCSPDFGVAGVFDRFGQIQPKVLFTADGYFYGGKTIDSLPTVREIAARIPSIEKIVVISYVDGERAEFDLPRAIRFLEFGDGKATLSFEPLPFDHPLYVLYSSGTTGIPKCIVHCAGGVLLQHLKEHVLHVDLRRDDRIFYFTTCGWMMWNWLVSALALGSTVVLYDGSPLYPDARVLWRMADRERVNVFGTSPRFLASCEKENVRPGSEFDLSHLRTVLSTGSPLAPESFRYVYREIKKDVQLSSISGGTDLAACFAQGSPIMPVYEGEIQCRALAMKVEIYDEEGHPLANEKGELVCTAPFPSMPIGFWNDTDGSKYHSAYFERYPNVWCHGDYAELTPRGGVIIYGRSDAVLNPGGVRIGTAEIYRQVDQLDEVIESLAIAQEWQNDVRVVLFVRLRAGVSLDDALRQRIRDAIRKNTTPRHVPAKIVQVADIPRTISGKLVELAVRNVVHGRPVKNVDALANPDALEFFRDLPELKS
jgi:acetoacetyl-CoA synthetase